MDPLPPISKVFSFISQEERQRSVTDVHNEPHVASFAVKTDGFKKPVNNQFYSNPSNKTQRGFCTHCNKFGHSLEKCYRIHGYPPGYKQRSKTNNTSSAYNVNQVSAQEFPLEVSSQDNASANPMEGFIQNLTPAQCQQFMTMFSSNIMNNSGSSITGLDIGTVSRVSGQTMEDDWQG